MTLATGRIGTYQGRARGDGNENDTCERAGCVRGVRRGWRAGKRAARLARRGRGTYVQPRGDQPRVRAGRTRAAYTCTGGGKSPTNHGPSSGLVGDGLETRAHLSPPVANADVQSPTQYLV